MASFRFFQDVKCTIWGRNHFEIEADTQEEAEEIARKYKDEDASEIEDSRVSFLDWSCIHDTLESILPIENEGQATMETYNSKLELIADNAEKAS